MEPYIETNSFKSGYVAVLGRPNVGKSTLINTLLGQKIAAVSPRPQTTRKRQLGILTLTNAQVVFVDTPGIHKPIHKLGESMNKEAEETIKDCDVILFIVDASEKPHPEDILLVNLLNKLGGAIPILLVLNKADRVDPEILTNHTAEFLALIPQALPIVISAAQGINLNLLQNLVIERLNVGSAYYPIDQLTDLYEREIAADLIREAALYLLRDEVPHGIAIRIDQFTERNEGGAFIAATIFVERESHKIIVIGQKGQMVKRIGTQARIEIEKMSGRKVFLQLRVKVRNNWRNDEKVLRWFGY